MILKTAKTVVLIILDGWGLAPASEANAISLAKTPNFNGYWQRYPHTQLQASGEAVGLPKGVDGNSQTGHLNLGAGKIVYQDLARIDLAINNHTFYSNKAFLQAINHAKKNHTNLHLMGLIGRGGVHTDNNHLFALLKTCQLQNFNRVFLHLFTDGRDSPPKSALIYLKQTESIIFKYKVGRIATIMGRYWSMDRDTRWSRTQKAYLALTQGKGLKFYTPQDAIKHAYINNQTDEFINPSIIINNDQKPITIINDNDSLIFFNYRIDRAKQLAKAFVIKDFPKQIEIAGNQQEPAFLRKKFLANLFFVSMTEYEKDLPVSSIAFPIEKIAMPLALVLSKNNLAQLHLAETEKERFVTYYFNGMREKPFPKEDWLIVPSPKIKTYDLKPEMSAEELTKAAIKNISSNMYNFILINFANPDMVGHTAIKKSCILAIEAVDKCLGKIIETVLALDKIVIVTADHGNIEEIFDKKLKSANTKHSINPVPFIYISNNKFPSLQLPRGILADVAVTVLKALGITKPSQMTGQSLIS